MHIKRISKKIRMCIIASLLIFTSAFSVLIGYQCQQKKVKDLQNELKMKKDIDNKNKGSYSTILNAQDIQLKFNEVNSYKIFSGTTTLKHKYEYERDSFLGLKSKGTLVANAKAYYEFQVDLKDAKISVIGNHIDITLPRAYLNKNSVHMVNNTFKVVEKETKDNILMNEKDGKDLQRYWIETFSTSAIEQLETYYDGGIMRDKLEEITRREVKMLIDTLGINQTNVQINIK